MVAIRIPGTSKIIFLPEHIGDTVIDLSNYPDIDSSIRNEDVKVIGNWTDYSGSGKTNPQEVMLQGIQDINPASFKGQILKSDIKRTNRGRKSSCYR